MKAKAAAAGSGSVDLGGGIKAMPGSTIIFERAGTFICKNADSQGRMVKGEKIELGTLLQEKKVKLLKTAKFPGDSEEYKIL